MEPNTYSDDLSSEVGVDYTQLRNLLRSGEWRAADEETARVMFEASKREKEGWLRVEDVNKFPCIDLRTIDQLWVKSSNGRFGFSVQKRIWEEVGGTPQDNYETGCKFGERVGWLRLSRGISWLRADEWLNHGDLTFTTQAPVGHLPWVGWVVVGLLGRLSGMRVALGVVGSLLSRKDL